MDAQVNGDTVRIVLASLLRVIDRLGVRTLGDRPDIDELEREVRSTLYAHLEDVGAADTAAGVALAHTLVEPILRRLRDRANLARDAGDAAFPAMGRLN